MDIFISHCPLTYCTFFENFDFEGKILEKKKMLEIFEIFENFHNFKNPR